MPHVPLEGIYNLRDLGGYATIEGLVVRANCLFRSDELHTLSDADLAVLSDLGIRVVFDLRNEWERELRPNPALGDVVVHERQAPPQEGGGATLEEKLAQGERPVQADDVEFGDIYIRLLTYLAGELRHIVELAADADAKPLLFHCVAGKDRTGITAAILLGLLGVPDDTILDDYELTTELWTPYRMQQLAELVKQYDLDEDDLRLTASARRPVLQRALDHVHATWGTYDQYAIDALGVTPETLDRLRTNLLAPTLVS